MPRLTISQQLTYAQQENEGLKAQLVSLQEQLTSARQREEEITESFRRWKEEHIASQEAAATKYIAEAETKLKSATELRDYYSQLQAKLVEQVNELHVLLDNFPGTPERFRENEYGSKVEMPAATRLAAFVAKQLFKAVG